MKQGYISAFIFYTLIAVLNQAIAQSGQWTQQPIQGSVSGLWAVSMQDTGLGIAAGMTDIGAGKSGVIRKTAGDPTWYPVPLMNFSPAIPGSFNAWYGAAAFSGSSTMFICGNNSKVYKSTDDGQNWTQQTNGINVSKTLFGMHFSGPNTGLVVGDDGVAFYTTDGGANWTPQTTTTTQTLLSVHSAGGIWYVSGANNTMLKFTPPSTWTFLSIAPHNAFGQALADVKFLTGTTGYASGGNALLTGKVLYTHNSGASWTDTQVPNQGVPYLFNAMWWFSTSTGWAANVFDAIYYTTNGGGNWTKHSAIPTIGAGGGVTELNFPTTDIGYGSGGAIGGSGPTTGWIIKWEPLQTAPEISVVDSIAFDTLGCGTVRNEAFIVENTGNANLTIPANGVTFSSPDFSLLSPSLPVTIPANDQRQFVIRWAPSAGFTGQLPPGTTMTINSNDPNTPNKVVTLTGIRINPSVALADTHLVFSAGCQGQTTELNIQGTPNGPDPRYLDWIFVSGDDAVTVVSPSPGTVISTPTTFKFQFNPVSSGPVSGTYYFFSGSSSCPDTAVVTFEGGVQQSALNIPATLDFGPVCTEHNGNIILDLANTGTGPVQIISRDFISGKDLFPDVMGTPWGPVNQGGSKPYTFRFRPGQFDTGAVSGTYRFILGPCPDTVTVTFTGFGVRNPIQVIPTNVLVLGPTPVGGQNDSQVLVNNNTSVPVEIASVRMQPTHTSIAWVGLPVFPTTIPPGGQLELDIRYTPTKIETLSADICVKYTSPCTDSVCIALAASSNNPPTIVVQNSFDVGLQRCDTPIMDTLTVYNTGPGMLTLTNLLVGGPQAAKFTVVSPASFPVNIVAGDSAFVVIEYSSAVEENSGAVLIINHNDPKTNKVNTVSLTATREVYSFIVEGDTTSTIQACYGSSASRTFTIRNTGVHELQLIDIGIDQPLQRFETGIIALPQVLQPGDSVVVTVTMKADFVGPAQGTLRISSEPCTFTREIPLRGEGLRSFVTFNPPQLDYGNITAGSSSDIQVDVRNTGLGGFTIDSIVYVPGSGEFSLIGAPTFPIQIPASGSIQFGARYAPTSGAGLTGTLCAYISDPCPDTICIDVSGSSNTDVLAADQGIVDIYLDPCTIGKECGSVTIKNFASVAHTVDQIEVLQTGTVFGTAQPQNVPFTVNPDEEFILQLCAGGTFTGTDTALVRVTTTTGAAPVEIRFIAHRDSVNLVVPPFVNMGVMARCEDQIFHTIIAMNTGTAADTLDVVSGLRAPFSLVTGLPIAMPPGQTRNIDIRFATTMYRIYADTLVLQSRRCGTTYRIVLNAAYLSRNYEVLPNPLVFGGVQAGTALTQSFSVQNMNLKQGRMAEVYFSDPAFSTTISLPITLDSGNVVSVPVMFSPTEQRGYAATACVVFDEPCLDTVCISLTGTGIEGQLKLSPPAVDLGTTVQCIVRSDTIVVQNTGSAAVVIDSVRMEGINAAAFAILNPIMAGEPLLPGQSRAFFVEFRAALVPEGPVQAALVVFTDDQNQPRLEAQFSGTRTTATVPGQLSLDFGTIQAGSPEARTLTITNNGSAAFTYMGAMLPPGITIAPPLPVTIPSGQSADFQITLTALQQGPLNTSFTLHVDAPCEDSTIVVCTGTVTSGITLVGALATPIASCDTVPMYVLLHNPLGEPISLDEITIEGVDAASFVHQSPPVPVTVPAGDSLEIIVLFIPDPARDLQYNAQCMVRITAGGSSSELRAVLTAIVYIPQLTLLGAADFGGVAVDDPPSELIVEYVNNSPFLLRVTSASFADPGFTFVSSVPAFPAVVQPGDTVFITVRFLPEDEGEFTGILQFDITEPCASSFQTAYLATGLPPNIIQVDLVVTEHSGAVDERVTIPLLLNNDLGSQGIEGWSVGLEFNRSMLYPLAVQKQGTLSEGMDVAMKWDFETGTVRLTGTGAPLATGTGVLANVEFLVLIGSAESTPIIISDSVWLDAQAAVQLMRQSGSFTLTDYCFSDGNRLIGTSGIDYLYPASPNPTATRTTIRYEVAEDGLVDITVLNSMGKLVRTLVSESKSRGKYDVELDTNGLPSGTYFVTMRRGAFMQTRQVLITR